MTLTDLMTPKTIIYPADAVCGAPGCGHPYAAHVLHGRPTICEACAEHETDFHTFRLQRLAGGTINRFAEHQEYAKAMQQKKVTSKPNTC
jgi:hypothetical protein